MSAGGGGARIIRPPNRLKQVLGPGSGVDPAAVKRAEASVSELKSRFDDVARAEIDRLREALAAARASAAGSGDAPADKRADEMAPIRDISRIAFELKACGTTFDFPLITAVGHALFEFTERLESAHPATFDVIAAHIDALSAIVAGEVRGDGGTTGRELVSGLAMLVRRQG
jgi:hypothetical protein